MGQHFYNLGVFTSIFKILQLIVMRHPKIVVFLFKQFIVFSKKVCTKMDHIS